MKQFQMRELPFKEFVSMMALMMSITALSIDAILPALEAIASDMGSADSKDAQQFIVAIFTGMALGQLLFGPLSDSIGRRSAIVSGYVIFVAASLMAIFASDHQTMLWARSLQGFGLAAPKVISVAIIRDLYKGRTMARVMSFIMMVFILVPMLAPLLGQLVMHFANWQAIFWVVLLVSMTSLGWYLIRQQETLEPQNRTVLSAKAMLEALKFVLSNRQSVGYTVAAGIISGPFIFYLSSASHLLADSYQLKEWFPIYFSALTISFAIASFINGKRVMKLGMRYISRFALSIITVSAAVFLPVAFYYQGHPPLEALTVYFIFTFFSLALIFGNLNSLAMEPLGQFAGLGSAIVGCLTTIISATLAVIIGSFYEGSVFPLVTGFALAGASSLAIAFWTDRKGHSESEESLSLQSKEL